MRPISGRMVVIHDQSSHKSLAQSTALLGTLSQYRVTVECSSLTKIALWLSMIVFKKLG